MSNFDFLSHNPQFALLAQAAQTAEKLLTVDAGSCAVQCRTAIEITIKWLYSVDISLSKPSQEQLAALLDTHDFRKLVGQGLWQRLDFIRKLGNAAVHTQQQVSKELAILALRHLHSFLNFVVGCYSSEHKPVAFDVAKAEKPSEGIDKPTATQEVHLDDLMQQNAALRSELSSLREHRRDTCEPKPEPSEFTTRKFYIDTMLMDVGWTEGKDWRNEVEVSGMPSKTGKGFVDYVLYGSDGKPLAVIEAKKTCKDPSIGRQQAKLYADALECKYGNRPVIFLSNGFETFIDDQDYPERRVAAIYAKRDLERLFALRNQRADLKKTKATEGIADRYYQKAAVKAVCESFEAKRRKFLLVMATGSGKTRTIIALCDILLRCGWVKNILFLADRTSLVTQAKRSFTNLLTYLSTANLVTEKEKCTARCIFSTYQTMINCIDTLRDNAGKILTSGHFDLIICDEAHRSIYNKYQDIFTYFDAPLVGLTATPKDEIDKNTYDLFELEKGVPTYGYDLDQAVKDGFLVPYLLVETRMKFMENGIVYDELPKEEQAIYEETFADEEDGGLPQQINSSAINTWLFNEDTIRQVLQVLMDHGLKINYGETIGKTIIFAKSHAHAEKILEVFNKHWPHLPGHAKVIDNRLKYAQSVIDEFSTPDSLPQIAISVDMLDTGIDVPEVLNLVFFKTVLSKAKFWQMIGRGTRLCPGLLDGNDKERFYIFDFCGNFAFFRESEGVEVPNPPTLQASLFTLKTQIVFKLQALEQQTDFLVEFRKCLVDELLAKTKELDVKNFAVQQHRRAVEKFSVPETWSALRQEDVVEIENEVAPLVLPDSGESKALRFDALMYGIELAAVMGKKHTKGLADLTRKVAAMAKVASIPEVRRQKELINTILQGEILKTGGLPEFERIRENLRGLVKYLKSDARRYDTNFTDSIIEFTFDAEQPQTSTLQNYRAKAEAYIREHTGDNQIIKKLHTNIPLSKNDLHELEDILWKNLGTKEDYEKTFGEKPLGEFVREIIGLDMNAAKKAFETYLTNTSLNSKQMYFINQIIEYIVQNGLLKDFSILQESPFVDQGTIDTLFDNPETFAGVIKAINKINENAKTA